MKTKSILRVVKQGDTFTLRKCLMDDEDDVVSMSFDYFAPKAYSPQELKEQLEIIQEAFSLPILTDNRQRGGWFDQDSFLDDIEGI